MAFITEEHVVSSRNERNMKVNFVVIACHNYGNITPNIYAEKHRKIKKNMIYRFLSAPVTRKCAK